MDKDLNIQTDYGGVDPPTDKWFGTRINTAESNHTTAFINSLACVTNMKTVSDSYLHNLFFDTV